MKVNKRVSCIVLFSMCCVKASTVPTPTFDFPDIEISAIRDLKESTHFDHAVLELMLVNFTNKSSRKITLRGDIALNAVESQGNIALDVGESKSVILPYTVGGVTGTTPIRFMWSQEVGGKMRRYSGSVAVETRSVAVETNKSTAGGLVPLTITIKDNGKYEKL